MELYLNQPLAISNHYKYPEYTRTCDRIILEVPKTREEFIPYFVVETLRNGEVMPELTEEYKARVNNDISRLKVDVLNQGEYVTRYIKPDNTVLIFEGEEKFHPYIDNGDGTMTRSDWEVEINLQGVAVYKENPAFYLPTSIGELQFYKMAVQNRQLGELEEAIVRSFERLKAIGKFKVSSQLGKQ